MLFRLLILCLAYMSVRALAAPVGPFTPTKPGGHAVVFSDLKLDDTAAIHHLASRNEYDHIHVVGTGINNHERAHGHLRDFVNQQPGMSMNKISYYSGGPNILHQPEDKTHEQHFQGSPSSVVKTADRHLASQLPRNAKVDIYHIAPTAPEHIYALADNRNINVQAYHHVAGYNSHVDDRSHKEGYSAGTERFLAGVHDRIKNNHKNANVIFTSNAASFSDTGGSTQPVRLLQGRYPQNHLDAAKNDPFHVRTLNAIEEHVRPVRNAKGEHAVPHVNPNHPGRPIDQQTVNQARFGESSSSGTLRSHMNKYLDKAEKIIDNKPGVHPMLMQRLKTGVRDAFTKEGQLELCDAAHVGCVNEVRRTNNTANVRPATFYKDTTSARPMMKLRPSRSGDPQHGHMLVNQTSADVQRNVLH